MNILKKSAKKLSLVIALTLGAAAVAGNASAAIFDGGLPSGWVCTGGCGTSGANGVVGLSPVGSSKYGWVSTNGGVSGNVLAAVGASSTNGSTLRSTLFSSNAGDALNFSFDFVTSDGAGFADYAWARLLDSSLNQIALLFTARTTPNGNSVPGFGMPAIAATIIPGVVTIVPGAPSWSPLGSSSGTCYSTGCGYTGWVASTYNVAAAGNYYLEFGTANYLDTSYQTGLAFDGITIGGKPIEDVPGNVPEPASLALLGLGLAGLSFMRRRKS